MNFQKERPAISKNRTSFDKISLHPGVTIGFEPQSSMPPWLLPFLAALSMTVFLVVSFALHHKRLVKQKRRISQYYALRYHRVAGPILNCSIQLDNLETYDLDKDDDEESNKLSLLTKSMSFKIKHSRYNTWSPQILKNRLTEHFGSKKRLESEKESENVFQVISKLKNLGTEESRSVVSSRRCSLLPECSSITDLELMTLADLSGFTRSYSCRSRAVGVTTMSGTLAVARHNPETPLERSDENISKIVYEEVHESNAENEEQFGTNDNEYEDDYRDSFHNPRSCKTQSVSLPQYLEDDAFSLTAKERCYTQPENMTSSDNIHYDSDDVFSFTAKERCYVQPENLTSHGDIHVDPDDVLSPSAKKKSCVQPENLTTHNDIHNNSDKVFQIYTNMDIVNPHPGNGVSTYIQNYPHSNHQQSQQILGNTPLSNFSYEPLDPSSLFNPNSQRNNFLKNHSGSSIFPTNDHSSKQQDTYNDQDNSIASTCISIVSNFKDKMSQTILNNEQTVKKHSKEFCNHLTNLEADSSHTETKGPNSHNCSGKNKELSNPRSDDSLTDGHKLPGLITHDTGVSEVEVAGHQRSDTSKGQSAETRTDESVFGCYDSCHDDDVTLDYNDDSLTSIHNVLIS